jgi:hypothetical protein
MSNLKPEKRLDKNGRLVTKHVKVQTAQPAAPMMPPPFAGFGTTLSSEFNDLNDIWATNRISKTKYTVEDFSPEAVSEINDLISESRKRGNTVGVQIAIGEALDLMATDGIKTGLHNVAVFGKIVLRHSNTDVTPFITALHEITAPREIDYLLDATPEERQWAETLVEFTVRAEEEIGDSVVRYSSEDPEEILTFTDLRDPQLGYFITEHPETMDEVLELLKVEGGAIPVDIIRERLAHSEKALRGGVL